MAQAQSGTGKTAAFTLGMLSRIDASKKIPQVRNYFSSQIGRNQLTLYQAICVSPTRELARQIYDVVTTMGKFTSIETVLAVAEEKC